MPAAVPVIRLRHLFLAMCQTTQTTSSCLWCLLMRMWKMLHLCRWTQF